MTKGPISAGRQLGRAFGFLPGPAGKRRRKRGLSSRATRLRNDLRIVEEQSGTQEEVIPRRAAEHRTVLTEDFGPMAGRTDRATSEPSGHVVE